MKNTKNSNDTLAFDYAIYMIVGSYFRSTRCTGPIFEKKLRLHYCEQKLSSQYKMEERCISFAEKVLFKELPTSLLTSDVSVSFLPRKGKNSIIHFSCKEFSLVIFGKMSGCRATFSYSLKL